MYKWDYYFIFSGLKLFRFLHRRLFFFYFKKKSLKSFFNIYNYLFFCFFFPRRSGHVGVRSVKVRDGLPQHRIQGVRGRGCQVLGFGGRHEQRTGPVARAAAVAPAVLRGATRVRGQVTGRRGRTSQRAAVRLVRPSRRAATATIAADPTADAPLSVDHVAAAAAVSTSAATTASAATEPQQQQLRDVGNGSGRRGHQVRGRRRGHGHRPHHSVVRHGRLPSPSSP